MRCFFIPKKEGRVIQISRGGRRPGAGRPSKPLKDKMLEGNPGKRPIKVLEFNNEHEEENLPIPPDYLSDKGKEIFNLTVEWLQRTECLDLIIPAHIEEYAMCKERWLECEAKNDKHGLLAKHPTTGQPMQSPYVQMAINYLKQADTAWNKIYSVVKENCTKDFRQGMPEDPMARLLREADARRGY